MSGTSDRADGLEAVQAERVFAQFRQRLLAGSRRDLLLVL